MPTFAIAFTGHRPNRLPSDPEQLEALKFTLHDELEVLAKQGYDTLYCGMAEGADMRCYEAAGLVGFLRKEWKRMRICCVLPYDNHYSKPASTIRTDAHDDLVMADSIVSWRRATAPDASISATAIWWTIATCCWLFTTALRPAVHPPPSNTPSSNTKRSS